MREITPRPVPARLLERAGRPSVLARLAPAAGLARQAGRTVLDALLPPSCLTCDAPVETQGQLCATCFTDTTFISEPLCRRCGVPFAHAQAAPGRTCESCLANPPPWGEARGALAYDNQSRRLVLPLKHADRPDLAAALATMMARAGASLLRRADLLVPVPLHRSRLFARRYNQSVLLARHLSRLSRVPSLPDALRRTRATTPLGDLSAAQRAHTLAGAIEVRDIRRPALANQRILLVDDVLTSGATARECTNALLDAGAAAVDVLVAARVPAPHSG
jgi:ComF family protein